MMEIEFNGKKSYTDYGLILNYFKPQPPQPNVIKIQVPFMNGSYDFSTIGSFGEITYQSRKISTSFEFISKDKSLMLTRYSQILNWLMYSGKQKLIYSSEPGYYYMARVEDVPTWDNSKRIGSLKVDFTGDPFKYKLDEFGTDIWDTFNFETDYTQYTNQFAINGTVTLQICNSGVNVSPVIISTAAMTLAFEGTTYNLMAGGNNLYAVRLKNGINNLIINGTGTLSIKFREQFL